MVVLFLNWLLTICVAYSHPGTLAWWLLPDSVGELPLEVEEDSTGTWSEIWVRPRLDNQAPPQTVMEQALGAKWAGLKFDKDAKVQRAALVLAGRRVVHFEGDSVRWGTFDGEKLIWSDGKIENFIDYKKKGRRGRRRGSSKINFGKISLPPLASKTKELNAWSMERIPTLLTKLAAGSDGGLTVRDLSAIAQISETHGSVLGFQFAANCSMEERAQIEDALAGAVNSKLTCWMEQNPEGGSKLLAALLQKPVIDCSARAVPKTKCGSATVPLADGFFLRQPKMALNLRECSEDLSSVIVHESLHLAGLREGETLDKALQQANSCQATSSSLHFENPGEGFLNDLQVQTRMFLFRKVRDDSEKWGWTTAERDFFLGVICTKMGDKHCPRRYFQLATEAHLPGMIELPEGNEVTWSALAAYNLFDSITEDIYRMKELVKYLHRDPNGTLLRRQESGVHRLHEFHVARSSLETVKANKNICNGETDDRVFCEDLFEIVKTPWFKNP